MRDPNDVLLEWYTGELGGEALFWALAQRADAATAPKWLALAQVESRVAARLAKQISVRTLEVPDIEAGRRYAIERAAATAAFDWRALMAWLEGIAAEALAEMQADAAELPSDLAAIGALVIHHEQALVAFARLELAGRGTDSLAPINAFLEVERAL